MQLEWGQQPRQIQRMASPLSRPNKHLVTRRDANLLIARPMSASGQKPTFRGYRRRSASPLNADIYEYTP
jgi:hypothetical protein